MVILFHLPSDEIAPARCSPTRNRAEIRLRVVTQSEEGHNRQGVNLPDLSAIPTCAQKVPNFGLFYLKYRPICKEICRKATVEGCGSKVQADAARGRYWASFNIWRHAAESSSPRNRRNPNVVDGNHGSGTPQFGGNLTAGKIYFGKRKGIGLPPNSRLSVSKRGIA